MLTIKRGLSLLSYTTSRNILFNSTKTLTTTSSSVCNRLIHHQQNRFGMEVIDKFKSKSIIVDLNKETLGDASTKVRNGGLVAFPTETVYGLGANALDEKAVLSIFEAKGRPLTDPVIVHIVDFDKAQSLLDLTPTQIWLFKKLAFTFWPGPLTIVARASSLIPPIVTANTGFVGVRYPRHPVAQQLIQESGVPIAAPSANRFGHVSPTLPVHVFDDLGHAPITILEPGESAPCAFGIESTVLKIVDDNNLCILRKGGVCERDIRQCLDDTTNNQKSFSNVNITSINKQVSNTTTEGQEAPGQLLTHYAPDIQAFILSSIIKENNQNNNQNNNNQNSKFKLSECVFIDFGNYLNGNQNQFLAYKDLSSSGKVLEAANVLFSTLRWSESVDNAKIILLPDLRRTDQIKSLDYSDAVFDRIFRAASGKTAHLDLINNHIFID